MSSVLLIVGNGKQSPESIKILRYILHNVGLLKRQGLRVKITKFSQDNDKIMKLVVKDGVARLPALYSKSGSHFGSLKIKEELNNLTSMPAMGPRSGRMGPRSDPMQNILRERLAEDDFTSYLAKDLFQRGPDGKLKGVSISAEEGGDPNAERFEDNLDDQFQRRMSDMNKRRKDMGMGESMAATPQRGGTGGDRGGMGNRGFTGYDNRGTGGMDDDDPRYDNVGDYDAPRSRPGQRGGNQAPPMGRNDVNDMMKQTGISGDFAADMAQPKDQDDEMLNAWLQNNMGSN
ncbi:hypothetical protein F-M6_0451 [Faustovirus]|nr:hypothetical protein F-LCD7_0447 [Faustovirus]QJX72214.1 hypothetical protein F-M6_0451 [Faustovirus]QJX73206.1 hypothetical protein F-VV57_0445 [Faustovirus]QJX73713.1 hypothetical protein F-VV63_0447 [Faustovirus]